VKTNSTIQLISILLITHVALAACQKAGPLSLGPAGAGKSSKLTDVNMQLPSSSIFVPSNGSATVNAVRLKVEPTDPTCENATNFDETKPYSNATIATKFAKSCEYNVMLAIGETKNGSFTAYYQNGSGQTVSKEALATSPAKIPLSLVLTADGKTAGMPASPKASDLQDNDATPSDPGTTGSLPALSSALANASLTTSSGSKVSMKEVFTTEYMIVDLAQVGCQPCVAHAQQLNSDTTFQQMTSGKGKCKSMIVVSSSTMSGWLSSFGGGATSFSGKTSYGFSNSTAFGRLFNFELTATPTVVVIDRSGRVLAQSVGSTPEEVEPLCR